MEDNDDYVDMKAIFEMSFCSTSSLQFKMCMGGSRPKNNAMETIEEDLQPANEEEPDETSLKKNDILISAGMTEPGADYDTSSLQFKMHMGGSRPKNNAMETTEEDRQPASEEELDEMSLNELKNSDILISAGMLEPGADYDTSSLQFKMRMGSSRPKNKTMETIEEDRQPASKEELDETSLSELKKRDILISAGIPEPGAGYNKIQAAEAMLQLSTTMGYYRETEGKANEMVAVKEESLNVDPNYNASDFLMSGRPIQNTEDYEEWTIDEDDIAEIVDAEENASTSITAHVKQENLSDSDGWF